jgi:hypothetical protein
MKICPACNRAYADETLVYCLDDGSTLSSQNDSAEIRLPATRPYDPPPTEILNRQPRTTQVSPVLPPTIQSLQPPPLYSTKQHASAEVKEGGRPWVLIAAVAFLVFAFGMGGVLSFIWFGKDRTAESSAKIPNTNVARTASPTPTNEVGEWGPRNESGSLTGENLTYYPGTTPEQCQADCTKDKRCRGFTFIRAGAYNPGDPAMCYQASVVKDMVTHKCCISAIKQ